MLHTTTVSIIFAQYAVWIVSRHIDSIHLLMLKTLISELKPTNLWCAENFVHFPFRSLGAPEFISLLQHGKCFREITISVA